MRDVVHRLFAPAAVMVVASIGLSGVGHTQQGRPPTDVNVVNEPVVDARQSGSWTVQIDDTNAPFVRDFDNPAFQPFQTRAFVTIPAGRDTGQTTAITVPANKVLVIEYVSGALTVPVGEDVLAVFVRTTAGGETVPHVFGATLVAEDISATDRWITSQAVRLYADPDTDVVVNVSITPYDGFDATESSVTLSGHFVDF